MSVRGLGGLSSRDRRALLIGTLVLLPGFAWIVGVRPYRAALAEVREQVAQERALLARERSLIESRPRLEEAVKKASARAELAERRLVTGANTALAEAELTDELEILAVETRVLLEEIRTVAPLPGEEELPGLERLRLAVRGESDLEGVLTFFRSIEESPLLLRIVGVTLDPVTERPEGEGDDDAPPPPARPTGVMEFGVVVEAFTIPTEIDRPDGTEEEQG